MKLFNLNALMVTSALAILLAGCSTPSTTQIVDTNRSGVVLIANDVGVGTGFIIQDNKIVTNNHVIEGKGDIVVYSDGSSKKYAAKLVYTDNIADIAVVQLNNWKDFNDTVHPKLLTLGNSEETKSGDKIIIMGHPWGLTWSVAEGIMSAKNRRLGTNPKFLDQVDAHLFQGNSGGPIFNDKGEVVCVSNMLIAKDGGSYGFCIPSNLVKKALYDMEKFGEVRWRVVNVTLGLTDDGSHVIVKDLEPTGAAAKAGIKIGDKILEIHTPKNHPQDIAPKEPNDLITEMAQMMGDEEEVKLLIDRNGEKLMFDVKSNYRLSKEYTPDTDK